METTKAKAFIFDLDGVITDTAEYHYLAWKQLGDEIGIPFDREFNEQLKGVSRSDSLERILEFGGRQNDFTAAEKEALAQKKNEHYVQLISTITKDDVLPGIIELLEDIQSHGLKIGMASASKNAFVVVERLGVQQYFEHIVDAATVQQGKPHPEVFMKAADALGVPYEACIGVEDAEAGVEAIRAAGMFAVGVGTKQAMAKADLIVSTTDELKFAQIIAQFEARA